MREMTKSEDQLIEDIINEIADRISELSAMIIKVYAPTLWLDFLNACPGDSKSMWSVYQKFTEFVQTLREQHECSREIMEMELLSRKEFLAKYPVESQADAETLHAGMKKIIDEKRDDLIGSLVRYIGEEPPETTEKKREKIGEAERILKGDADIPEVSFTIGLLTIDEDDPDWNEYKYTAQLHIASANHRNFWLSIVLEGMIILSYKNGKIIAQRCAAPDCRKYFVPTSRSSNQRYHSKRCRNRHHMQVWRQSQRSTP